MKAEDFIILGMVAARLGYDTPNILFTDITYSHMMLQKPVESTRDWLTAEIEKDHVKLEFVKIRDGLRVSMGYSAMVNTLVVGLPPETLEQFKTKGK